MKRCFSVVVLAGGLLAVAAVVWSGCASGESADPDCTADRHCPDGQVCDEALGVCEEPRTNGGGSNDDTDPDNQDDDNTVTPPNAGNDDNGDDNDDNDDNDVTPPTNNDDGPAGSCVEAWEDCDSADQDQGDYWCVETEDGDGVCVPKCDEEFSAQGCPEASMCREFESLGQLGCSPSACEAHEDCEEGTCIQYENDYGICIEDGTGIRGADCAGGLGGECAEGMVCDGPDDGIGTCRAVCDPWDGSSCPEFDQVCDVSFPRTGICTFETTTTGTEPYDQGCSPDENWCTDATQCLEGADESFCYKYCRADDADCPSFSSGTPGVCDTHVSYEVDTLGLCMPACEGDEDCPDGTECFDQLCRTPCADPVQDCCPDGEPDCGAECDADGYCS